MKSDSERKEYTIIQAQPYSRRECRPPDAQVGSLMLLMSQRTVDASVNYPAHCCDTLKCTTLTSSMKTTNRVLDGGRCIATNARSPAHLQCHCLLAINSSRQMAVAAQEAET